MNYNQIAQSNCEFAGCTRFESFGKGSANNVMQNHLTGHAIAEFGDHRWLDVATCN